MSLTSITTEREERVEKAVQKGIDLLDQKGPKNWRERIDLDTFDIGSLNNCVLGQVYGSWHDGMNALFPSTVTGRSDVAAHYGFDGVGFYAELQDEWTDRMLNG